MSWRPSSTSVVSWSTVSSLFCKVTARSSATTMAEDSNAALTVLNEALYKRQNAYIDTRTHTLFLLLSTASHVFIPVTFRSSFTLSIHVFGWLQLLFSFHASIWR